MKIPVTVKVLLLMVSSTLFYAYIGQLVPQKEVHPPEVIEMSSDLTTDELVDIGKGIFDGKGLCVTCHTIGRTGALRFPDLDGIATRSASRIPGLSSIDYIAQSLYRPDEFIVDGFSKGMPPISKPPIGLTDDEIIAVVAFLQTLGGTPTVSMETVLAYSAGAPDGVVVAAATTADGADPAAALPAGPLARFGCTGCHYTDQAGRLEAASLIDVGTRLSKTEILVWLTDHQPPLTGTYANEATVADVRTLIDTLTALKGQG